MARKRCPRCCSFKTKRLGFRYRNRVTSYGTKEESVQRWFCKNCFSSFSAKRKNNTKYQGSVAFKAADLYFASGASYRAVGRILNIKPIKVFELINNFGSNCKSFVEVAKELKPRWSGYLLVDGKTIHVKKERYALLLTADAKTQDIPYANFTPNEDYEGYKSLLINVKKYINYPIKGIVIDGDPGLVSAVTEVFPYIDYQLCIRHLDEYHNYYFKYLYNNSNIGVAEFLDISHKLLYATEPECIDYVYKKYLQFLDKFDRKIGFKKLLNNFESKFGHLWVHYRYNGLPRTTNIIEGIIRQLILNRHQYA